MDSGQIVAQSEPLEILPSDTPDSLGERIKTSLELELYPRALQLLASGQVHYRYQED